MRKTGVIKIGKIIQKIRLSNGYTQEELAEAIDITARHISDIEQDRSKPSYEVIIGICNLFNISLDQIFSKHLQAKGNKTLDYSLSGYERLSKRDKELIDNMIIFLNKKSNKGK